MQILEKPAIRHPVVSREQWLAARLDLLKQEKELTRLRDKHRRLRQELPWVKVEKDYIFDTPQGKRSLADLFDGRSQLFVKHFMFGPGWKEGCVGCSFEVDHIEGALVHLSNHDVSYVAVARAPIAELEAFRQRMGWIFPLVSSYGNTFNYDFHVSFTKEQLSRGKVFHNFEQTELPPGMDELSGDSVFIRDEDGQIYHTYSTYGRGAEELLTSYMVLDLTPKGRNENGRGNLTDWVRHHDRYGAGGYVDQTGRYVATEKASDKSGCNCASEASRS